VVLEVWFNSSRNLNKSLISASLGSTGVNRKSGERQGDSQDSSQESGLLKVIKK
jgi:hypothetical protein